MSEPIASPACTYTLIASGVTCSVFGLDGEALIFGFAGGLIAQSFIPAKNDDGSPVSAKRAFLLLIACAVMAAIFYPFAEPALHSVANGASKNAIKIAASFLIGMIAPLIPRFVRDKFSGGKS